MAIAGVNPLGEVKTIYINPINGEPMAVNDVSAGEYYDREKIREILIKFASKVEAFDEMEPPFVPDVDKFIESGE